MKLVHFPESPDPRFRLYLDVPEEGCVYTLEGDALIQYPRHVDGALDGGAEVLVDGIEEASHPYIDAVEALLRDVGRHLHRVERCLADARDASRRREGGVDGEGL